MSNYNSTEHRQRDLTKVAMFCTRKKTWYQELAKTSKRMFVSTTFCILLMKTPFPLPISIVVLLSTPKFWQKSKVKTRKGGTPPDSVKISIPSQANINISVLLVKGIAPMSFWAPTSYRRWTQHLLCHSTTRLIGIFCPFSVFKNQFTILKVTLIKYFFHCDEQTIKGRGCESTFHSFKNNFYRKVLEVISCYDCRGEWRLLDTQRNRLNSSVCVQLLNLPFSEHRHNEFHRRKLLLFLRLSSRQTITWFSRFFSAEKFFNNQIFAVVLPAVSNC